MGKRDGEYSGNHIVYYTSESGREHMLDVDFTYDVERDGIGSYEFWGHMEYDEGEPYMENIDIYSILLVRECLHADRKEDIPKGAFDIKEINDPKRGHYWIYSTSRKIDPRGDYADHCEEVIREEYDFAADVEDKYDYRDDYDY